jgi:Haloacid dehalogenase-like hydrolase
MRVAGPVGFDLDLTLINSRPAIMAAWQAVGDELGVSIDLAEVDRRMGIKLEDEVAYWFPETSHGDAAASYRRHYVRLAPTMTFPLPGAPGGPRGGPRGGRAGCGGHREASGVGAAQPRGDWPGAG